MNAYLQLYKKKLADKETLPLLKEYTELKLFIFKQQKA